MGKTTEAMEYCKYTLEKLGAHPVLKSVGSFVFLFLAKYFSGIDQQAIVIIYMLMFADFVTGTIAASHAGEGIKSSKIIRSVEKMFLYGILMITGFLVDQIIGINLAHTSVIVFIGVTEFWSILENISKAGYPVPTGLGKQFKRLAEGKK